jgi:hypothetical protein
MSELEFVKNLFLVENTTVKEVEECIDLQELITEISKEKDLQEYSKEINTELHNTSAELVLELSKNFSNSLILFTSLQGLKGDLSGISKSLSGYQETLEKISTEIQLLQEKSLYLNKKLKNRKNMQQKISLNLDGILVSDENLKRIFQGEVNEFFLQDLKEVNRKMRFVKDLKSKNISALKDVGPVLERVRIKASEKSREFLLRKIDGIKSTSTNIGVLQGSVLLKFKDLYSFLCERYVEVAVEVRQSYVGLARNYYESLFERYIKGLSRLQVND